MVFEAANEAFLLRNKEFPVRNMAFLLGNMAILVRNVVIETIKSLFRAEIGIQRGKECILMVITALLDALAFQSCSLFS